MSQRTLRLLLIAASAGYLACCILAVILIGTKS